MTSPPFNPTRQCSCHEEPQATFTESHPVCCLADCDNPTTTIVGAVQRGGKSLPIVWLCDEHSGYRPSSAICKACLHPMDDHNYRPGRTTRICLHRPMHNSPPHDVCGCTAHEINRKDYMHAGLSYDQFKLFILGEFDEDGQDVEA